jgi:hypothetical protein
MSSSPAPGTAGYVYPIGTPGSAWGAEERAQWLARVGPPRRLYAEHVLAKLEPLRESFDVEQYGLLDYSSVVAGGFGARYPLMCVKSRGWSADKPTVLITGGVHGYETSGVQGVLSFVREKMGSFVDRANFLVAPCVSPWGYEHIQRWTCAALDPNRGFHEGTQVEECAALRRLIAAAGADFLMHVDCHETTDSDETEFTPAKQARDGKVYTPEAIPDGVRAPPPAAARQTGPRRRSPAPTPFSPPPPPTPARSFTSWATPPTRSTRGTRR